MKFRISRNTYKQKYGLIDKSNLKPKFPNTKIIDPSIPKIRSGLVITKKNNMNSIIPKLSLPPPTVGQNHPEEKLFVPEPLQNGSSKISSFLPLIRNRNAYPFK